jgi:phage-related protein
MADTFTYPPSSGTSGTMMPRVLRARFGDGYVQEAGDGINPLLRRWELTFEPIHATTATNPSLADLDAFFKAQAGYKKFLWTQLKPYDTEGPQYFVCTEWSFTYARGLQVGLRAVFEQRPT